MGRSQRRQARQIPPGICLARRLAIIPIATRRNGICVRDRAPSFIGIAPIEHTLIGGVGAMKPAAAGAWLARMRRLGETAS